MQRFVFIFQEILLSQNIFSYYALHSTYLSQPLIVPYYYIGGSETSELFLILSSKTLLFPGIIPFIIGVLLLLLLFYGAKWLICGVWFGVIEG